MNEHTKGPWYVTIDRWNYRRYIYATERVRDADGDEWNPLIAVTDDDKALVNWAANARLIAAAPDLLRLLIRYRNETPLGNQPHMIAEEADKVIAQATGESE